MIAFKWRSVLLLGAVGVLLRTASIFAESNTNSDCHLFERVKSLGSLDMHEQVQLLRDGGAEWRLLAGALADQLERGPDDVRCCAAILIGEMHFDTDAGHLARWITVKDMYRRERGGGEGWGPYPALGALLQLGKPAENEMIHNLAVSKDEKVRAFSLYVIQSIEGQEIAEAVLKQAVDKQNDPEAKTQLQAALDVLKTKPRPPF